MFNCVECNKMFTRKDMLARHVNTHNGVRFPCSECGLLFTHKDNMRRHMKVVHVHAQPILEQVAVAEAGPSNDMEFMNDNDDSFLYDLADGIESAILCDAEGPSRKRHNENEVSRIKQKRARLNLVGDATSFVEVGRSFNNTVTWYYRKNTENHFHFPSFLNSIKTELEEKLQSVYLPVKFNLKLEATYNKPHVDNSSEDRAFKTSARAIYLDSNIGEVINEMFSTILSEQDVYQGKGSGFSLEKIDGLLLGVYKYNPMGGSSYIQLPADIENKKAVVNPQNTDQQCFKWAILAKHVTGENRRRIDENYRQHENKYNFNGLTFPTPLNEIKVFEKNNMATSVNVYGIQEYKDDKIVKYNVYPLKVVEEEKENHFDLILISDEEKTHYTYISNFSRLVRSQKTKHKESVVFCKRCFSSFDEQKKIKLAGQEALDEHKLICNSHKPILPKMPEEGSTLEFRAWGNTQRHPFVIYADFEALLVKCDEQKGKNSIAFQKHKPMSYGIYVKADDSIPLELIKEFDIPTSIIIYRGDETREEVARNFGETVVRISRKIEDLMKTNKKIIITKEQLEKHNLCQLCNLCKKRFTSSADKIQDHCHLSGKFRQTLCNKCNLALKLPKFVPCFLHNLSNYDAHFIVTELGYDEKNITVIPNSDEKYISFSKYISNKFTVRFIDTFRFLPSSLSNLASNLLTADFEKFRETSKHFCAEDMVLVTRKGVYPYEYTNSWEKLVENELPPKDCFYNTLREENITEEEYEHAKEVWKHFNCSTLGEYSDLYLKIDVLLLTDVFENFRDICLSTYNLDAAFYFTAPGLSFDACLKFTAIRLELLTDYDMLLLFEKGIRGGLTQASKRYAKANNLKAPEYDTDKPNSWIIYQDCNNLYGWAMSQYMPYGGFKWVEPTINGINDLDETSDIGRIYEVDISYPKELHDFHNELPFLAVNKVPPGSRTEKLMATLERKERYIIHYRNLQQAIAHGLVVEKVYRVVQFYQSPWLAKYINLNTEMRKKAKNDFDKDFYKLMNNSVFGKLFYFL